MFNKTSWSLKLINIHLIINKFGGGNQADLQMWTALPCKVYVFHNLLLRICSSVSAPVHLTNIC